ncbi:MAG TPA: altronate hydrolase, partial [Ruminococcus sp.]|nr:altronate hydrolase [Ruminococcus sp.]
MKNTIVISPADSVGVALTPLKKGESAEGVILKENIEKGHKFALRAIAKGEKVIKYGEVIGRAKTDIGEGEHVHTHNMATNLEGTLEYSYNKKAAAKLDAVKTRSVEVYERKNGEVGIRNELWVIPTVGCVNSQAKAIVKEFERRHPNAEGIDGCFTFTHPYGCSQIGDDHERTRLILQRMVKHPNCGGVLVFGLGCENNRMDIFKETLGEYDEERTEFLVAQEVGDEIAEGVAKLEKLYEKAKNDKRVTKDISCLKIGLKCGG